MLPWVNQMLTNRMAVFMLFGWVVLLTAVSINTYVILDQKFARYEPLTYTNPRRVLDREVEQGTFIDVYFQWCNEDSNALITSSTAFSGPKGVLVPRGTVDFVDLSIGCHEETVRVNLPETVTPGRWVYGGTDRAVSSDGHVQSVTWYTDSFLVTPNGSP